MPVCPYGHKLRRQILGDMKELSAPLALLRGFYFALMTLLFGMLQDQRFPHSHTPHPGLLITTGFALFVGAVALSDAWAWAGKIGPARRLAWRAFGMAVWSLLSAGVACHALYFKWADPAEAACGRQALRLFGLVFRRP